MKPLLKISVRNGALAGMIGFLLLTGLYYLGRHPFIIPVFMDFRIFLFCVFIFFTLREIRDYHQQGVLYFWQGIIASFIFTFCYALLAGALLLVFMRVEPDFLADYIRLSVEQLKAMPPEIIERIGPEAFERNVDLLPETRAVDLAMLYFLQSFLISLFISIILSVILRKQPKT